MGNIVALRLLGVPTVEQVAGSEGADPVWVEGWVRFRDANAMDTFLTSWRSGGDYWFLSRRNSVRDHGEWYSFRLRRWPKPENKWTKRSLWLAYSAEKGRFAKGHDWAWLTQQQPELGREIEAFVAEFLALFG
jgi:hypothetical protein